LGQYSTNLNLGNFKPPPWTLHEQHMVRYIADAPPAARSHRHGESDARIAPTFTPTCRNETGGGTFARQ
jgi:hypothetical protein